MSRTRLTRSSRNKMLLGVCGGIAEYWGWDPTIVRVIFVIATLIGFGSPIVLYIILAVILPRY